MRKPALTLACLMASMAQAAPVTELNPLVVTASRSEHSLANIPLVDIATLYRGK